MGQHLPTMKLILGNLIFLFFVFTTACSHTFVSAEKPSIPVGTIEPELDYSREAPTCEVAAQRIRDYVKVGMALADVRRLVGQPRTITPGMWWWTAGFSKNGLPVVRYPFGPGDDDVAVSSFSADDSSC